jgi:hypothetical protein
MFLGKSRLLIAKNALSFLRDAHKVDPMDPKLPEQEFSEEETTRRMNDALRRAFRTPPTPVKEIVGTSKRAVTQRVDRIRKASRSKPKAP